MNLLKNIVKGVLFPFVFIYSCLIFLFSKRTIKLGYVAFRYLFTFTNGKLNDVASYLISKIQKKYSIEKVEGVLGVIGKEEVFNIVNSIKKNGYYAFDKKLDDNTVKELKLFAESTKVSYLQYENERIKYSSNEIIFDKNEPVSPRYQFKNGQLIKNQEIQKLIFDESVLTIANAYLNAKPILDIVTMWWSVPFKDERSKDKAAQMFHFDMDRFKFLKFFFYLNDVDANNGPHCFIKGSHKSLPKEILKDRRIKDEEVYKYYKESDVLELEGRAGSIIAVDTRGLHKGKPLTQGARLLFQLQFSNSLYGAPYKPIQDVNLSPNQTSLKNKYPRTYQLLSS